MIGVATSKLCLAALTVLALAVAGLGPSGAVASGGVSGPGSGGTESGASGDGDGGGECVRAMFGKRNLERGDCGGDVTTLNWILRAVDFDVPLKRRFGDPTHRAVRSFQARKGVSKSGVVNGTTHDALVGTMKRHKASWYGPGFYGNTTACGQTLRRKTRGVAHRTLPCGTKVVVKYGNRFVRTKVIDRGPYVKRRYERDWDLSGALAKRLRFSGVDHIRTAVIR